MSNVAAAPPPRTRRGVELVMLAFAVVIAVGAWANVGLAHVAHLPTNMLVYGASFAALALLAHIVVRFFAPYADPLLLPAVTLLNGIGLVLIHRLDLGDSGGTDAPMQLVWTAVGIALFVAVLVLVRDHRVLQRYTYTAGAAGLVLLAIPALLPSAYSEVNGAKIWIRFGGFSIQPGEFAKLLLMIFFAGYLVAKRDVLSLAGRRLLLIDLPRARDLGPVLVAWGGSLCVLVFEDDLGTSLLFFGIFVAMLYVATQRTSWLLIGLLLFAGGAFASSQIFGHVRERIDIWLHPWAGNNATNDAYQLVQGLYGLANGGVLGTGLGQGRPNIVPFAKTDFIVATAGEELGLTGLMAILIIYGLIVERGLRAALAARDPFAKLLAAGLAFALALQVFVVVGGVTRLIPLTGLTTPFLSYGGSSLVANWALIALLMRVSDGARRPPPKPSEDDAMTQVVRR
ncbi:MAG: FtsW/RodA/SpoVE family cell cycle protein [Streptosporangiaceae bacterium]